MGMGSCTEVQTLTSGKSTSARRPAGLQIIRKGTGSIVKPRIIHTYSPKVYKIKPEEFLDLVQKLTGRSNSAKSEDSTTSTLGFSESESKSEENVISRSSQLPAELHERDEYEADTTVVGTPVSTQLLASLPSPRFVTMNFLPMLSASPSPFNRSQRDAGFSFPHIKPLLG